MVLLSLEVFVSNWNYCLLAVKTLWFWIAVYSESQPNEEIAKAIAEKARELGLESPLLIPFKSLDYRINYRINHKSSYGVDIFFVENPQGIVSGNEAIDILTKFNRKGNSGAQRVYRYSNGDWDADWNNLADSNGYGRVDFVCGEATAKSLENAVLDSVDGINKAALREVDRLNARIKRAKGLAFKTLQVLSKPYFL